MASSPQKHGSLIAEATNVTGRMTFAGGGGSMTPIGPSTASFGCSYDQWVPSTHYIELTNHRHLVSGLKTQHIKKWRVVDPKRYAIVLAYVGEHTPALISVVEKLTGLGSDEAGRVVVETPKILKTGMNEAEASSELQELEAAGAQAYLLEPDPSEDAAGATDLTEVPVAIPVAPVMHVPVTDFRKEAERIGVPLVGGLSEHDAATVVRTIAEDAVDLFPTPETAQAFLFDNPINESSQTAVQLVQTRGPIALLLILDQMRFGANG